MNYERDLAERICKVSAQNIVDQNGGVSMGGITLSEKYAERRYKAGDTDMNDIWECQQALRHWVDAVGYNSDGKFEIVMSNYIQNC